MIKFLLTALGILLMLIGMLAFISPLPFGIVIMALGLSVLVCVEPHARRLLQRLRTRSESLNRHLHWCENKLEDRLTVLHTALLETRPAQASEKRR